MRPVIASGVLLLASLTLAGATGVLSTAPAAPDIAAAAAAADAVLFHGDADIAAQDVLHMGSMATGEPLRHRREKAHLMKRMSRKHGTWNTAHPRYRLLEALYGFAKYRERNMAELDRWRARYGKVGRAHKKMLEKAVDYKRKLRNIEQQIYENEVLCNAIVDYATTFYGIEQKELAAHIKDAEKAGRVADRIGPSQTLKHFVRDWADDGSKERDDAFPCILTTLSALAPPAASPRLRILLPGSGLGRLGTEIANLGRFQVTLNEYSMAMNIAYRFLTSTPAQHFAFHPFVDALSHHSTTANLLRRVDAPNAPPNPDVLLVEGDFNTAFNDQQAAFDVVVTHFFIDTARNLVAYFDTIHRLLAPGGRWVNLGPLLYGTAPLVQLSLDEIVAVVEAMGFEFEDVGGQCGALSFEGEEGGRGKVRWMEAEYGFDPRALVRNAYKAQVWVVRKV